MMYFCQPLEEQLFPWLGSAAAGWPAQAWESAQKYTLQGLICIALIIPNKPVLSHAILTKCQNVPSFCVSFKFHMFLRLVTAMSYENRKLCPCLELACSIICVYGFR